MEGEEETSGENSTDLFKDQDIFSRRRRAEGDGHGLTVMWRRLTSGETTVARRTGSDSVEGCEG